MDEDENENPGSLATNDDDDDMSARFNLLLLLAAVLRIILIFWGKYQDSNSELPYTDIDYRVFTDSARCLIHANHCTTATGALIPWIDPLQRIGDPYARDTYRYTPLLAILISPNILLFPEFGKVIFALSDLIIGVLLYRRLRKKDRTTASQASNYVGIIWLLNPIIANISTRGSAESVLGVVVIGTLVLAEKRRWDLAAVAFGLAVHFKIYPIIYGSSLLAAISSSSQSKGWLGIKREHIRFGVISFASFMSLNAIMYSM
jgi:phosphatidylinositol glycan class M